MKIRIYDYDDNAVNIEIPDKPIECIDVTVLSGDTLRGRHTARFRCVGR